MTLPLDRRTLLLGAAATTMLAACAAGPSTSKWPPIVFVHGNGDTAGLWMTTVWRFESNGWPRDRLHAIEIPYPLARDDDTQSQAGRSSTADNRAALAAEVDRVLAATGARQVVLIANSRGGNAVRNYIAHGGAAQVSHAILCGTPNHGVYADPTRGPNAEFNGAGVFLAGLNTPQGPDGNEVTPGVAWLTIRSDHNDKYAQPDGVWIGAKGKPTNVTFEGPALKGATNVVIPGIDHRETAYNPQAFEAMFRFITGQPPVSLAITPEASVRLDGQVSGYFAYGAAGCRPDQPAAGGCERRGLCDRCRERHAARAGGAPPGRRRRWALGAIRGGRQGALRIRAGRAGLRDDAHLPLAVSALVDAGQHAGRESARWRQGRDRAGVHDAATRLLRRAARPALAGRQ